MPKHKTKAKPKAKAKAKAKTKARIKAKTKPQDIIDQCEAVWNANKDDCNAFVKAVTKPYGITLTGDANSIVDQIQTGKWTSIGKDGVAAKAAADQGKLVVGGLKGADATPPTVHGHVVIVVSGPLAHSKYPTGYWGMLGGVGKKNTTINYAWNKDSRDDVIYASMEV